MLRKIVGICVLLSTTSVFAMSYEETKAKVETFLGRYELTSGSDSDCSKQIDIFLYPISYKTQKHLFGEKLHKAEKPRRFDEIGIEITSADGVVATISDINEGDIYHRNENPMCMSPFPCYDKWQYLNSTLTDNTIVSVHGYAKSSTLSNNPKPAFDGLFVKTTVVVNDDDVKLVKERLDAKGIQTSSRLSCNYTR